MSLNDGAKTKTVMIRDGADEAEVPLYCCRFFTAIPHCKNCVCIVHYLSFLYWCTIIC